VTSDGAFQARVVESLARLVFEQSGGGYADVRASAVTIAMNWIDWLNTAWPNLSGSPIAGPPTNFPAPGVSAPTRTREDPRIAALVLRACMWLRGSDALSAGQLVTVGAVAARCWAYLELRFRMPPGNAMRFTWSATTGGNAEFYYGPWQFEIVATLGYLLLHFEHAPTAIPKARLKQRLAQTRWWVEKNTIKV
jgi:hypothetical protein